MKRRNFFKGLLGAVGLAGLGHFPVKEEVTGSNPVQPAVKSNEYVNTYTETEIMDFQAPYRLVPHNKKDKDFADAINAILRHELYKWEKELKKDLFKNCI